MRLQHAVALTAALAAASACDSRSTASLESDEEKASYAIGRNVGASLEAAAGRLDLDAFRLGVEDALAGREPAVAQEELEAAIQQFAAAIDEEQQRSRVARAERNRSEGAQYLEQNGARDEVTTTESGLQYEVLEEGEGARPSPTDRVTIHYRGTLVDGTEFDSSYERGEPATFGVTGVIPGFSEGLQLMSVGSRYRFVIPSELGYGSQGAGDNIGPDATLVFEVELLEIP